MEKQYRDGDAKKDKMMWEKEEGDKHAALWAGVIFFMSLIIFLWFLNTKSLFEYFNFNKKKSFNIDQFSVEFDQALAEFKSDTEKMKNEPVPNGFRLQVPNDQGKQ